MAVLGIGFVLGVLYNDIPNMVLKKEFSLGEIANLILASFIAVYIPFFLDKKINNRRIEKDILIQSCNNIYNEIYDLKKTMIDPIYIDEAIIKKSQSKAIVIKVQLIGNMLKLAIKNSLLYINNKEVKEITESLKNNQISFWTDLTANVYDKRPKISQETYRLTEININEYSNNISELIMRINNS